MTQDEVLDALVAHLKDETGAVIREKRQASEMRALAQVFGAVHLVQAGLPTSDDFMRRFTTTLGPVVYPSLELATSPMRHLVYVHEFAHVKQFWNEPISFPVLYLSDIEYRAGKEAQAIHSELEVYHWLTGKIPEKLTDLPRGLAYGYAFSEAELLFAQRLLEVGMTMLVNGVYSTEVGIIAEKWLNTKHPELYHACSY